MSENFADKNQNPELPQKEPSLRATLNIEDGLRRQGRDLRTVATEYLDLLLDQVTLVGRLARIPAYTRRFEAAMDKGDAVTAQRLIMEAGLVHQVWIDEITAIKITIAIHHKECHTAWITIEK
jgi:hypothetical protein